MAEELTEEEQRVIKRMSDAIASELASGIKKERIIARLVAQKWPRAGAVKFVDSVAEALKRFEKTPRGERLATMRHKRRMIYGAIWLCGGSAICIIAFFMGVLFTISGWVAYLASGIAILFGIAELIRGLSGWIKVVRSG